MSSPETMERRVAGKIVLPDLFFACLVILFVALTCNASRQESVTNDEFRHLSTGVHYWQSGDYSFDAATPPLWKMALALPAYLAGANTVRFREVTDVFKGSEPWLVATDFMRDNASAYNGYLQAARLVNILAAVACLILLYSFCRRRFGPGAALFGTAFLAFSPTVLAHSHYATTDVIATLALMAVIFLLTGYLHKPDPGRLAGAALIFGLSILCKFTLILLFPLLLLLPVLVALKHRGVFAGIRQRLIFAGEFLPKSLLLVVALPLLTVNIFYGFKDTGTPLTQMHLESKALSALAQSPAGLLPIPLPKTFVEGFDRQKADSDYAEFPAYLMGSWSEEGFRSYYLAAFCMKESISFLLLVAVALFLTGRRKECRLSRGELLLLCYVPLTLIVVLSFMNRLNVGVRYLLPAYPFLCFFIARLYWSCKEWRYAQLALSFLFVVHSVSVLRISPNYISYFNELSGGAAYGYRNLIDSNIDWGQDLPSLKKFMTEHGVDKIQLAYFGHGLPEIYGINYEPLTQPAKPGYAAISVTLLQGHPYLLTYIDPPQIAEAGQYSAMGQLQPVGRAGYSLLIYKID